MKRLLDIILALFGLIVTSVPILLLMLLIKLTSIGPAIYWSERIGQKGKSFLMPKLRTMSHGAPVLPTYRFNNAEKYITGLGKFLRRTSLDEMPQLLSVFKGDMSIVGPRPMIPADTVLLAMRQKSGLENLRPGITGWAQINGRDNISNSQKVALDLEYLQRQSLMFDFYIIGRTIIYVVTRKGILH